MVTSRVFCVIMLGTFLLIYKEVSVLQIRHMEANFGRLSHAALDLQPGLNVITAPNESGKSTWCSFIRNMLYGLSTRTRGALADKNRYAPWDGSAMQGRMDLRGGGEDYTVLRTTRRANAPMGEFACTYYNTATPVPDITGSNLGETLLGVPREVFERSAFIGQSGLAVDQDAELERRIAALITTGEEETSFSETYDRLKKQLNRRRHNKTGQIPALELEMDDLRRSLAVLENYTARVSELQSELEQTAECIAALETARGAVVADRAAAKAAALRAGVPDRERGRAPRRGAGAGRRHAPRTRRAAADADAVRRAADRPVPRAQGPAGQGAGGPTGRRAGQGALRSAPALSRE